MPPRFLPLFLLAFMACQGDPPPAQPAAQPAPSPAVLDTAAAFRTAVADYIRAMDTSAAPLPDTVFIGRHVEFPLIALPHTIANRTVLLIEPSIGEAEQQRTPFAYLNIFTDWTPGEVEFYVVRFAHGLKHDPDGADDRHLHYRVNGTHELVLETVGR